MCIIYYIYIIYVYELVVYNMYTYLHVNEKNIYVRLVYIVLFITEKYNTDTDTIYLEHNTYNTWYSIYRRDLVVTFV